MPDAYDILLQDIRTDRFYKTLDINKQYYEHLYSRRTSPMTPEEQLFADFFQKHINILHPYVQDMDILEIRAYREKMALIAKEGKAAVYAADKAEQEVKKAKNNSAKNANLPGFDRSLEQDGVTSNAINVIKDRQKRLSKQEKLHKMLMDIPGMSAAEASQMLSNTELLKRFKNKNQGEDLEKLKAEKVIQEENNKPMFNPFEKK